MSVLWDEGPGGAAMALGDWDGKRVLAIRWNGSNAEGEALGNPQSSGHPTWFIVPDVLAWPIVQSLAMLRQHTAVPVISDDGLRATLDWLCQNAMNPSGVSDEHMSTGGDDNA